VLNVLNLRFSGAEKLQNTGYQWIILLFQMMRGRALMNTTDPKNDIIAQLTSNRADFDNSIAGWIGLDEPWALDFWGPIKRVSEIIDANSANAKLWFQFNVGWNGRFGDPGDPARGEQADMIEEFMRRVKKANVWITYWLYDKPCNESNMHLWPCMQWQDKGFRITNIDFAADSLYRKVANAGKLHPGLQYGMSIQTGQYRYHYGGAWEENVREISGDARKSFYYRKSLY
jgi:hypothetical protein